MIEFIFASKARRKDFAATVVGVRDEDVALDPAASDPTGQINIPKAKNRGELDKRLEIVLG